MGALNNCNKYTYILIGTKRNTTEKVSLAPELTSMRNAGTLMESTGPHRDFVGEENYFPLGKACLVLVLEF